MNLSPARWLSLPGRRPASVLAAAGAVTLLALLGTRYLRADASLDAMFPRGDPAATTLVHVLDQFGTADELLVLVTLDDDKPDPQRLLDFAGRFERAVAAAPDSALTGGVIDRLEPDGQRFIERELVPSAMDYLDDASLAAARQRFTPRGMRDALAHDAEMMGQPGPAASALAKALLQDPLNLHEFLLPRLAAASPMRTYNGGAALISPDGTALLIRVLGKRPPTDLPYARALVQLAQSAAGSADPRGLHVICSGGYAIAADSERAIRHDSVTGIVGSVVLLLAVFVAVYRRPIALFHLAFAPIALGTLWGFGVYGIWRQSVSPLAAVIGGALAGMGIDYSVLYLTRYSAARNAGASPVQAIEQTVSDIGMALLAAFVTSVAGFVATGWSSVRALRDFSILGTVGLTGCFLAVLFVLPALLALLGGHRPQPPARLNFRRSMLAAGRHRAALAIACAAAMAACLVIALWPGGVLRMESDLMVMHPWPHPALDAEAEIGRRFGASPESLLVHLQAATPDGLVALACAAQSRLEAPSLNDVGISGVYGLATWLPDPAVVAARRDSVTPGDADRVVADFNAAVAASPFNAGARFAEYAGFLHDLLSRGGAPTLRTLLDYPSLVRNILPTSASPAQLPTEAVTVIFFDRPIEDRGARDAAIDAIDRALAGLPGVTLTGLAVVGRDTEQTVWHDLPRLLLVSAALVAGYLLLHFRDARAMLLSLLPAIFGLIGLAALVRLADVRLNMVNLVALPLLLGIDVDYGIYLVSLSRRADADGRPKLEAVASGAQAVAVCAGSMIVGYASLLFTSIPAERSLGWVVAAGVTICLLGALAWLAPLLLRPPSNAIRQNKSPGES